MSHGTSERRAVQRRGRGKPQLWGFLLPTLCLIFVGGGCNSFRTQEDLRGGIASLTRNRPQQAREAFQRAADQSGGDPNTLLQIAGLYAATNRSEESLAWLGRLEARTLTPEQRGQMAGIYALMLKKTGKACAEWEKGLGAADKDGEYLNNYAYACLVEPGKDLDRAISLLDRAVILTGRRAHVVDSLGWAYFRRYQSGKAEGDLERAMEALQEAVKKEPRSAPLRYHLGRVYVEKDLDSAYVELTKAMTLYNKMPARVAESEGEPEARAALNAVEKARQRK